jgi:hypothetical protein
MCVGLGAAAAVLGAALGGRSLYVRIGASVGVGTLVGVFVGLLFNWYHAVGGAIGADLAAFGAVVLVGGTLRRGGTHAGTAILVGIAAIVLAALAIAPVIGYVEPFVVLALALRAHRRAPERYAGLRTLARD